MNNKLIANEPLILKVEYVNKRKIEEKEFTIYIVPNRFNADYPEYVNNYSKVSEASEKLKAAKDLKEVEKISDELKEMGLNSILKKKYSLVETIMIANGIEFDLNFWDLKVNPASVDKFIVECMLKDKPVEVKKKLLEQVFLIMDGLLPV